MSESRRIPHGQLDKLRVIAAQISGAVGVPFGLGGEGQEGKEGRRADLASETLAGPGPAWPLWLSPCDVRAATVTPSATREPGVQEM